MATKAKGKWKTQATVDLGSLIQGLAYMGNLSSQEETRDMQMSNNYQNQVNSYLKGTTNLTDVNELTQIRDEMAKRFGGVKLYGTSDRYEGTSGISKYPDAVGYSDFQIKQIDEKINSVNKMLGMGEGSPGAVAALAEENDKTLIMWDDLLKEPDFTSETAMNKIDAIEIQLGNVMTMRGNFMSEFEQFYGLPQHGDIATLLTQMKSIHGFELEQLTGIKQGSPFGITRPRQAGLLDALSKSHEIDELGPLTEWDSKQDAISNTMIADTMKKGFETLDSYNLSFDIINGKLPSEVDANGNTIWTLFQIGDDNVPIKTHITEDDILNDWLPSLTKDHIKLQSLNNDLSLHGVSAPFLKGISLDKDKELIENVSQRLSEGEAPIEIIETGIEDKGKQESYDITKPIGSMLDPTIKTEIGTFEFGRAIYDEFGQRRVEQFPTNRTQQQDVDKAWNGYVEKLQEKMSEKYVYKWYETGERLEREKMEKVRGEVMRRKDAYNKIFETAESTSKAKKSWWDSLSTRDKQRILKVKDVEDLSVVTTREGETTILGTSGTAPKSMYDELRPGSPLHPDYSK